MHLKYPLFFIIHPQCKFNPGITATYAARKETKGDAPRRQTRIVCGVHLPAHGNRRVDDRAVDQFILRAHPNRPGAGTDFCSLHSRLATSCGGRDRCRLPGSRARNTARACTTRSVKYVRCRLSCQAPLHKAVSTQLQSIRRVTGRAIGNDIRQLRQEIRAGRTRSGGARQRIKSLVRVSCQKYKLRRHRQSLGK